jgi:CspA family cold shock protein
MIKNIINRLTNNKVKTMKEGTVKFFNRTKGFGFIKPTDSEEDVFVHQTGLIDEIHENDNVSFDVERGEKGLNAINVKLAR